MNKQVPGGVFALAVLAVALVAVFAATQAAPRRAPVETPEMLASPAAPGGAAAAAKAPESDGPTPVPLPVKDIVGKTGTGDTFRLSDHKGKLVLLNFWATWCPPCRAEIPDLIRVQDKYKGRLVIVGLSQDDTLEKAATFAKRERLNYPVLLVDAETSSKLEVTALPTSYLVDGQGRIVWGARGMVDEATLVEAVEKAL